MARPDPVRIPTVVLSIPVKAPTIPEITRATPMTRLLEVSPDPSKNI